MVGVIIYFSSLYFVKNMACCSNSPTLFVKCCKISYSLVTPLQGFEFVQYLIESVSRQLATNCKLLKNGIVQLLFQVVEKASGRVLQPWQPSLVFLGQRRSFFIGDLETHKENCFPAYHPVDKDDSFLWLVTQCSRL